jgi:cysteine desulfurase
MIYLDNAATTKLCTPAYDAMVSCLTGNFGNPSSIHASGQKAAATLYRSREIIAACIGAEPSEITFTSGGTEADNQSILSAALSGAETGKKHIVSTAFEHHAVINTLKKLEKQGFEITFLDVSGPECGGEGVVSPEQVAGAIRPDTCLVTVMSANNEIGTIQPVGEIGRICREKGVPFHTDAVQTAGHLRINLREQNIDMLSLSAHKFGGPKGAGVIFARKGLKLSPLMEGGSQERGKRPGTENLPAIAGMAAALEYSCKNIDADADRMRKLQDRLIDGISAIPGSILSGDRVKRLPGNVHFCFEGIESETLLLLLDNKGICASAGSACVSGSLEPSHVLLAIGRTPEIALGALRLTLGPDNTPEEIDETVDAVRETVAKLRSLRGTLY